jgi:hypothetical protein
MASNSGAVIDPADGRADDWLELHNPTDTPVTLTNWSLSDGLATFVIPSGHSIPANGKLLVWADEETAQNTGSGQLHVNFKLSVNGETLSLRAPDGTLVDTVAFGLQLRNRSQGRIPDGGNIIDFLETPGAGLPNTAAVPKPVATIDSTALNGMLTITVSTTAGFSYQLQSVTDLNGTAWTNLGPAVTATASQLDFQDTILPGGRRFYRVVRTP